MKRWFCLGLLAAACSDSTSDRERPDFEITLSPEGRLRLPEQLIGRPYLLQSTFSRDETISTVSILRGRIVRFAVDHAGALSLVERIHETDPDSERIVLAQFGGSEFRDGVYDLDFIAGFSTLRLSFAVYRWWEMPPEIEVDVLNTELVKSARDSKTLFWDTRTEVGAPGISSETVRLIHDLTPYDPPSAFAPTENNAIGSFYVGPPVAPRPADPPRSFVQRHDITHRITFFVTRNTPDARVADIHTAADYWNQIFAELNLGRPLEIAEAPVDGDPRLSAGHVIAWAESSAGAGRALNATDPQTGRTVRSLVYVTESFDAEGRNAAQTEWALGQLERSQAPTPLDENRLARLVSDYYVQTYAHELGHALGLRHNFAASLDTSIEPSALRSTFANYAAADALPDGVRLSSSIMEYMPTLTAMMVGHHMRGSTRALPYDRMAIDELYGAGHRDLGLFCEEETDPTYADCAEFDEGEAPFYGFAWQARRALEAAALAIARAAQAGGVSERLEVDGLIVGTLLAQAAEQLQAAAQFLDLRSEYGDPMTPQELEDYRRRVAERQQVWLRDQSVPYHALFHELASGVAGDASIGRITGTLLTLTEDYLARLEIPPNPEQLAAQRDVFRRALGAALAPALEGDYVKVPPAGN